MGTERLMMGTERMRSGQRASAHARYRISVGMRIAVLSTNIDIVWCPGGYASIARTVRNAGGGGVE